MIGLKVGALTLAATLFAAQAFAAGEEGAESPADSPHPGAVALSESKPGQWSYKAFPSLRPLYVNENDSDGKSTCYEGCAMAWPPLAAEQQVADVGHWAVVERDTGELQWAYKGKPVYQRFHDSVTKPRGDGLDGFHLLRP